MRLLVDGVSLLRVAAERVAEVPVSDRNPATFLSQRGTTQEGRELENEMCCHLHSHTGLKGAPEPSMDRTDPNQQDDVLRND